MGATLLSDPRAPRCFALTEEDPVGAAPGAVLVIDDNDEGRRTVAALLRERGYPVECAANGQEALVQLGSMPRPALILLDLQMPGMDGRGFLEWRRHQADQVGIPVVLLATASALDGQGSAFGVSDYLPKPIDVDELLRIVSSYCS